MKIQITFQVLLRIFRSTTSFLYHLNFVLIHTHPFCRWPFISFDNRATTCVIEDCRNYMNAIKNMDGKQTLTNTFNLQCKLDGSRLASGFMLQKSNASPIFGFTASPSLAHSDSSLKPGKELLLAFAEGNIVSPPSSTSDLTKITTTIHHHFG